MGYKLNLNTKIRVKLTQKGANALNESLGLKGKDAKKTNDLYDTSIWWFAYLFGDVCGSLRGMEEYFYPIVEVVQPEFEDSSWQMELPLIAEGEISEGAFLASKAKMTVKSIRNGTNYSCPVIKLDQQGGVHVFPSPEAVAMGIDISGNVEMTVEVED